MRELARPRSPPWLLGNADLTAPSGGLAPGPWFPYHEGLADPGPHLAVWRVSRRRWGGRALGAPAPREVAVAFVSPKGLEYDLLAAIFSFHDY